MNNSQSISKKWYQVIIDGSLHLTNNEVWEILERISRKICAKFGVMEHLDGQPKKGKTLSFLELEQRQWEPVEMVELLRLMESIGDLDWGDFYLFQTEPKPWDWDMSEDFPSLVGISDTTVRVIDGNLFYVHTPSKEVVEMIKESFGTVESIKFTELENHIYPY